MELEYCETGNMIADILTKALPTPKFKELKEMLNITSVEDYQSGNYSKGAVENTM
jgi:hypothetical protein